MSKFSRRRFLRGTLHGATVTVALPFLDAFLDGNGKARASGAPIPQRFGTWSWGLGMSESIFVPKRTGANFDLPMEIAALAPVQEHINLYTNSSCNRSKATFCRLASSLARSNSPSATLWARESC